MSLRSVMAIVLGRAEEETLCLSIIFAEDNYD